ncbi:MAG: hypothetical protein ACOYXT_16540 [Bacteroidota bacterium]
MRIVLSAKKPNRKHMINVGLLVRLKAQAGKEKSLPISFNKRYRSPKPKKKQLPGMQFRSMSLRLESLTPFQAMPVERRIWKAK